MLKQEYNSTLFLKFHLLSVIKPQKIKILSCLVTRDYMLIAPSKRSKFTKLKKLTLHPMGKFFISSSNEFFATASAAAKIRIPTINNMIYFTVKLLIQVHFCCGKIRFVYLSIKIHTIVTLQFKCGILSLNLLIFFEKLECVF